MDNESRHRLAIVDCGTNTFSLHVARVTVEGWSTVFQQKRFVRLGADSFRTGRLAPDRMRRGWDVLKSFKETALNLGVTHLRAIGCSALRDAANAGEFLERAAEIGWDIGVIDGEREADWIHLGVADTFPLDVLGARSALTLDIGGGSVECVLWDARGVRDRRSLDIGVARLTDWIKPSDPLKAKDIASLHRVVDAALDPLLQDMQGDGPHVLIGTSGAFNTLAVLENPSAQWADPRTADVLPLETLRSRCQALCHLSKEELQRTPGIHPDRVPYMAIACALIVRLLERFPGLEEVRRSRHTVAEGLLVEAVQDFKAGLDPAWQPWTEGRSGDI